MEAPSASAPVGCSLSYAHHQHSFVFCPYGHTAGIRFTDHDLLSAAKATTSTYVCFFKKYNPSDEMIAVRKGQSQHFHVMVQSDTESSCTSIKHHTENPVPNA